MCVSVGCDESLTQRFANHESKLDNSPVYIKRLFTMGCVISLSAFGGEVCDACACVEAIFNHGASVKLITHKADGQLYK